MTIKILEAAQRELRTRRAISALTLEAGPLFRAQEYAALAALLESYESRPVHLISGNATLYSVGGPHQFLLNQRPEGPQLIFESYLLNDAFFVELIGDVIRGAIEIAADRGLEGSISIYGETRQRRKLLQTIPLPLPEDVGAAVELGIPLAIELGQAEQRVTLDDARPMAARNIALRDSRPPKPAKPVDVNVFYATDRKPTGDTRPSRFYGFKHDDHLNFGVCRVSIPPSPRHALGRLETPSIFKLQFKPDPNKHIVLAEVSVLNETDFYDAVRGNEQVLVFVHGYNVTFEDAARRTSQIAYDLKFAGAPILYSWPSRGTVLGYTYDEARVGATEWNLADFLLALRDRAGVNEIHLVAHSMGNRAVTAALEKVQAKSAASMPPFNQIVLAAPDLDAQELRYLAQRIDGIGRRITLYGSSADKAIVASKKFHAAQRAGEGGKSLCVVPGIDSVDASTIDTDFLAHSYIADSSLLLGDLRELVNYDTPPDDRLAIESRRAGGWQFVPVKS